MVTSLIQKDIVSGENIRGKKLHKVDKWKETASDSEEAKPIYGCSIF
jgi:hypothetical protein